MTRILALVDDSIYARSVVAHAAWLSRQTGADVELLHVVDPQRAAVRHLAPMAGLAVGLGPGLAGEVSRLVERDRGPAMVRGAELVEQAEAEMHALGVQNLTSRVVEGRMLDVVREAEGDTDIIIMGKRGESADLARLPLGSVSTELARVATKPILLAARSFRPISNWLLAFSPGKDLDCGIKRLAAANILPPMPCRILHAGKTDEATTEEATMIERSMNEAGVAASIEIERGEVDQIVPQHVVRSGVNLIALGGLKRSSPWSAIAGGGTAEMLIRACQVPALLLR